MTSKPASLRARAMILAPRSWPSRPTLPTNSRTFRSLFISEVHPSFTVGAKNFLERAADLAHGSVGAHRLEDRRHQVFPAPGGPVEHLESPRVTQPVARRPHRPQTVDLPGLDLGSNLE